MFEKWNIVRKENILMDSYKKMIKAFNFNIYELTTLVK